MTEQEKYIKAQERVESIKRFYKHLIIYLLVILILFISSIFISLSDFWFFWVAIIIWGIILFIKWLNIFVMPNIFNYQWEERKIKEIMQSMDFEEK